ncbi:Predicted SnoaL-like aldol condensation-catalyzing enzyme [Shimia gijangensis]|uniref:Predicted SnoaL-like aldol condensation-catalyzing enzyme n=1 Tax=Shimia gijangensis TaxID=1470563 RepID=A0A1M6M884_9RHOB|nr:hypothetical protein [Shimia gijangensis]SHJ79656.1 Predicted SnoaL-like aldol condensation-catalyzing enzyme [Shimia gijangensis]
MPPSRPDQIRALLKSIETGESGPIAVVNQARYIQHNPQTLEGSEGLEELFKRLSLTNPKVNIVRAFEDGDFVFGHTEYDFSTRRIGFEVFRYDGDQVVEHWDNIQARRGPNPSGRSMVDGPVEARDLDLTEANRALVSRFVDEVLIAQNWGRMDGFCVDGQLIQHDADLPDGVEALRISVGPQETAKQYQHRHRTLACGDFVLTVCEGDQAGKHSSFYDMFRVQEGKLAEHWNTVERVPPREVWKNDNGKF